MPNPNPEGWLTVDELLEKMETVRAGRSLREFAAHLGGLSFQNLGQMLQRKRPPSPAVVQLLGYKAVTVYAPITNKKASKQ